MSSGLAVGSTDALACAANKLCPGDRTYAFYGGKPNSGVVKSIDAVKGTIQFQPSDKAEAYPFPSAKVAIVSRGSCLPTAPTLCQGKSAIRSRSVGGTILGYYPNGFILFVDAGATAPVSIPFDEVTVPGAPAPAKAAPKADADEAEAAAKAAAAALNLVKEGPADPDCDKNPEAPSKSPLLALAQSVAAGESPGLRDYLKLWGEPSRLKASENPWRDCKDPVNFGHAVKRDAAGQLLAACAPDTLYSWGPLKKIQELETTIGDQASWQSRPFHMDARKQQAALWLTRSPSASFGYGSLDEAGGHAIRVKLKPGVKFYFSRREIICKDVPEEQAKSTVFLWIHHNDHGGGKLSSGENFYLCSSEPIESWSYGTREFYDELAKDVSRVLNPAHVNDWWSYARRPDLTTGVYEPRLWDLQSDEHPFSKTQLTNTFNLLLQMSARQVGKVYVNPSVDGSAATKRRQHFKTKTPIWFNDN